MIEKHILPTSLVALLTSAVLGAAPPGPPSSLRVNDVVAPVGTGADVWFGWHGNDPDPDDIQSAYQILVSSSAEKLAAEAGDVWDSGKVGSRMQNHVPAGGSTLESDRTYHWKIRTWDKDGGEGSWSAPARFSTGLLGNDGWAGSHWIKRDSKDADDRTRYRKAVDLPDKPVTRATVYVSAVHKYSLFLNGELVGKGTAYQHPQYQYYNAFDITPRLRPEARNQFAVFHHWFGGGQGRPESARGMILKAIVHHTDGSKTEIVSDGTWLQSRAEEWVSGQKHRNRGEGVGYVEKIDARKLTPDWTAPDFDDSSWKPAVVIGPHPIEPWTGDLSPDLTRIDERIIKPASVTRKGGTWLVDLGKVWTGVPRIEFSGGKPGEVVDMLGGYGLDPSGRIDPKQNQNTDMSYHAVLSGEAFLFEPAEYLGLRYFEIENPPMPVTKENFRFIVRHSRMDAEVSSFESSDEILNRVWDFMKHSILTCAQEEYVDTPTREKGGFLGDGVTQSTVAMPVFNERPLTQRVLREFLQSMEQHWSKPADRGRMNAVYPNNDGGRDIPDFTQAYLTWVWSYYMETGDRSFLGTHFGKFADIGGYLERHIDGKTGLVTKLTGGSNAYEFGIVDWPATMRYGYDMETEARTVINAWTYAGFDILSKIAGELGKSDEAGRWRDAADKLEGAINKSLVNQAGVYHDGLKSGGDPSSHVSQHANMFPLALGIVPVESRASVTAKVKELRMKVGMVTVMWLVRALGEAGEGEALLDLLTNPEQPGWARCLELGATATWESWDALETHQSQSHAWGAAGLEAHTRYILGIRPVKPQYEEVLIAPLDFRGKLEAAKGTIATDRGPISVDWKHTPDSFGIKVDIPVNVTATVSLPRGKAASPVVRVNGNEVTATVEGDRLVIPRVGSGRHTIVRLD